ncbi:actin-like ATPase domain-containing protein [Choiromyces venosus 120613-1]|uniref:Actin-like ATPase domain-containing protein n=1 Tax=Choiromyces venosus 120613-1 TaxID=1336337 RepID=A0A3N4J069_9PEZI|nr:actin-like ATPase domain-containing protein [Choiromyces venosus 120613-1]
MAQITGYNSIKIGIDFGTTYSGIAWAHTSTPEEINRNRTSAKAPSEISYGPSGVKWGFGIPSREPRLAWFKLLLDPSKYSLDNATNSPLTKTKQMIPIGKRPVNVVADYLSELHKHTIDHLVKALGKEVVEVSPLDFILTVPAVWSDAAKNLTLQAAELAGFGRKSSLRLISEPEAAAVSCLRDIEPNHLQVGDTFVVADCGGGTVDVISYTITKKSPLEVVECVKGTGGMCGSTVLNERFEDLVRRRIGNRFDKMKPEGRIHMMKQFNDILKPGFTDSEDEDIFTCSIPGVADDADAGIEDGFFVIDREDMRKIFDPVVQKVIQLVQQQVKEVEKLPANAPLSGGEWLHIDTLSRIILSRQTRQVKALVLVGGFGESEYLRCRLEAEIRTKDGKKIIILQPPNAWTAVVRGAVIRGLEGEMVLTRMVTKHYGIECDEPFIEGLHPKRDAYTDPFTGEDMCGRRMRWFIHRGQSVRESDPIRSTFIVDKGSIEELDNKFNFALLASESVSPSDTSSSPDVYTVCDLEVDLSKVPKDKFKKKIAINGQPVYRLTFDLLISIQSATLVFEFDVDGKVYNDVKACYNYL